MGASSNSDSRDRLEGLDEATESHPLPLEGERGTKLTSGGLSRGQQGSGRDVDSDSSPAEIDTDSNLHPGRLGGESRAGVGPLGGAPARGDTLDAEAWRRQTGMSGPSTVHKNEEALGVDSPDDNSEVRDGPVVSGTATTPNTPPAPNTPSITPTEGNNDKSS